MTKAFQLQPSGENIFLPDRPDFEGGEGSIYRLIDGVRCAKNLRLVTTEKKEKLSWMVDHPLPVDSDWSHRDVAWPEQLLVERSSGSVVGYVSRFFRDYRDLASAFNANERKRSFPGWVYRYSVRLAMNLAAAFARVHRHGVIVGDVSAGNTLFNGSALVGLIDCDSFQLSVANKVFPCCVGTEEYTPAELQGCSDYSTVRRVKEHDHFGLAVLIYQIVSDGAHPYNGCVDMGKQGRTSIPPGIPERISQNLWPHSSRAGGKPKVTPPPHAAGFDTFPDELRQLFVRAFDGTPTERPTPEDFVGALKSFDRLLRACTKEPMHLYRNGLTVCPWCDLRARTHCDSFAST